MIKVQINLTVNPNKMNEVLYLLNEDKLNSTLSNGIITEFDIINNEKNKIYIRTVCESIEKLSEHMLKSDYKWKDLKNSGAIISQRHRFINI